MAERRVSIQHLRVARATDRLAEVVAFYRELFDFEVIGSFEDHEGFDGVMLGRPGDGFHLEFTHERGHANESVRSDEDLIVLYCDEPDWGEIVRRVRERGVATVASHNPYWDRHGITIEDPDGRRVVVHGGPWQQRKEAP